MQICEKHWAMLRLAIETRGLSQFVVTDGETAMKQALDQLDGHDAPYDPLASCAWMIMGRATQQGGLYLMTGDYCPICEAVKHTNLDGVPVPQAEVEKHWTDGPADAALAECKRLGMVQTQ
jgi:hypothetical protein